MRILYFGDARRVRAILEGDRRAAERWVVDEYPRVYRMLRYLTGSREAAEDLTQQTFVEAWQGLSRFRAESSLRTWLLRIAYHQYAHWVRQRRSPEELPEAAAYVDPACAAGLATIMVEHALATLSDDLRATFVLFYVHEMSIKEIADVLQIPRGTVKSRLYAARKALRERLSQTAPETGGAESSGEAAVEVRP